MPAIGECPDVQHLRELLLGRIAQPEADDLEHHLSSCNRCVQTVAKLSTDDTLVEAVRHAHCPVVEESDPILHDLMDRLKHREASPANSAVGTTTVPQAVELSSAATAHPLWGHERGQATERLFDFLAPARGGGEIGWLGHYRVLALLGSGGMGVVFRAEDSHLKRPVALKVMKSGLMVNPQQRQRFSREAQMTALIEHDHIVTIYQVGEDHGVAFLAMQLLKGETLEERVSRIGMLPVLEVLRIGREMARGLAAAHEHGLVHRDIKPGNIWLEADTDRVKILDFGLARNAQDIQLSERGVILGTPAYMPPEQARGETVGPASDLFSLGAVLYRLCTGKLPFNGTDTMSILMAIGLDQPQPPVEVNKDVPAALSNLIMRLLEKKPADRPASAAEVETALATIEGALTAPPPPRRLLRIVAALLLLGVLGAVAFWFGTKVLHPKPVVQEPKAQDGELVLTNDDEDVQVIVQQGGVEVQRLDLKGPHSLTLAEGEYDLRLAEPRQGLQLVPDHVAVVPGEKRSFTVRRIGQLQCLDKLGATVSAVAFSPRENEGLAASDRFVLLLDLARGTETASWSGHRSQVRCVAFSADGRFALSGSGGRDAKPDLSVRLWDVSQGQEIRPFVGHKSWVTSVAFAPDGKWAISGSRDKSAILWDVATGRVLRRLEGHDSDVNAVAVSADGHRVLTGSSDNTVRLWDSETGAELVRLEGHTDSVRSVALSPDGRWALSGGVDHTLRLWDLESGEELRQFDGHEGWVNGVAFAPDGRRVLSGSADRTVRLWDAVMGQEICRFREHTDAVQSVAFSPDGRRALSGGLDRAVRVWRLP